MNHVFIQALVDLYDQCPETYPDLAARSLAVLLDQEMAEMEKNGIAITRESLLNQVKETLKKYPKQKAS